MNYCARKMRALRSQCFSPQMNNWHNNLFVSGVSWIHNTGIPWLVRFQLVQSLV